MGRKIPAKKHRGVKDPLEQQARRLQSIKSKINAPPKDPDEQPVPRSLTRLFAFQEKDKGVEKPINKKKNKQLSQIKGKDNASGVGQGRSDNPIRRLRKLPGESGRGFSLRINSAIKALHDPMQQQHYPKDMEDGDMEDYKGERMAAQRERRARKQRRAHASAARAGAPAQPRLTRTQKLAHKKKDKIMKSEELRNLERREVVYERVAFGEVSHAPPALHFNNKKLTAAARAATAAGTGAPRPGRRSLLLTSMLSGPGAGAGAGAAAAADLLRRERVRLDAIAAYRTLKASKHKHKS